MRYILGLALLCLLAGCEKKYSTQKTGAHDLFTKTMVPSQFFSINADQDNVVEGADGTTIALPKGCFKNKNGDIATGTVKVELAEALSMDKMFASNLTTTSDGNQLETGGMIYLNASANNEELTINKNRPVYISIPARNKRDGMMVYRGVRDDNGNMNWIKPKKTEVFLTAVDVNTLDFLPENFEGAVKHAMPFGGQKRATSAFIDSLYYSFSTLGNYNYGKEGVELDEVSRRLKETGGSPQSGANLREAQDNPDKKIIDGAYTKKSYDYSEKPANNLLSASSMDTIAREHQEIDPARIKALKDPHFNKTLIATHEFETRLRYIFKTCNADVLEIYVKHLDKDLWELDQMAADKLGAEPVAKQFRKFAAQKLTNVKDAPEQATLMADYYDKQVKKIGADIENLRSQLNKELKAKQQTADSMKDAYMNLLWKREKYRMEKYNFRWTDMGWVNIDTPSSIGVIAVKQPPVKLEVKVANGGSFDRVHVYVVNSDIKSLYKLGTDDNIIHYAGNRDERSMVMKNKQKGYLVAVAYKGEKAYMAVKEYTVGVEERVNIAVRPSTQDAISATMRDIEKGRYDPGKPQEKKEEGTMSVSRKSEYLEENSVEVDLAYQESFYKEDKRQQDLYHDREVLDALERIVYPCHCASQQMSAAARLFRSNCASCHALYVATTGPPLAGVTRRHSRKWLYSWTRNWNDLVAAGDREAILAQNYSPSQMNLFPTLKDGDLKMLYDYFECEGDKPMTNTANK